MSQSEKESVARNSRTEICGADPMSVEERPRGSSREYLRQVFSGAAKLMERGQEKEVRDFTVTVFQLSELLRAFRKSPQGRIDGEQGVAAQMDLSRNAIYVWLDSVQLNPDDLRSADDLVSLLHKSPVLRPTVEKYLAHGDGADSSVKAR